MRACFLGENICALGFGVAIMQTPSLREPEAGEREVGEPIGDPKASFPADLALENPMTREWRRKAGIMEQVLWSDPAAGRHP
jgi:hypothetical protein